MNRKTLSVGLAAAVVVFVALAAIVFSPGLLQPRTTLPDTGNGGDTGDGDGNGDTTPQESVPVETPTWKVGDSWTYNVSSSSAEPSMAYDDSYGIKGNLTRTVTAIEGDAYNVSLTGAFEATGAYMLDELSSGSPATIVIGRVDASDVTVGGYTLYRTTDLALLKDVTSIHIGGTLETDMGTYTAFYTKTVEVTYDPAFDIWDFPLDENETWDARTNATIRVTISGMVEGPDLDHTDDRNFTVTVPIRLPFESGELVDVDTPAGTFGSVPVRLALPEIQTAGLGDRLGLVMGLGSYMPWRPHVAASTWFSSEVGNIVKAEAKLGDCGIEIVLVAYETA